MLKSTEPRRVTYLNSFQYDAVAVFIQRYQTRRIVYPRSEDYPCSSRISTAKENGTLSPKKLRLNISGCDVSAWPAWRRRLKSNLPRTWLHYNDSQKHRSYTE